MVRSDAVVVAMPIREGFSDDYLIVKLVYFEKMLRDFMLIRYLSIHFKLLNGTISKRASVGNKKATPQLSCVF
jgi:hypothetical protein